LSKEHNMSQSLLFDIEYLNQKTMKWELVKQSIGIFAKHPLREHIRDTEVGYSYVENINDKSVESFKSQAGFEVRPTRILYFNQIRDLRNEIKEIYSSEEYKGDKVLESATVGIEWIVAYILDEVKIFSWIEENIRLIFYVV